jgi:hypothetical protein
MKMKIDFKKHNQPQPQPVRQQSPTTQKKLNNNKDILIIRMGFRALSFIYFKKSYCSQPPWS